MHKGTLGMGVETSRLLVDVPFEPTNELSRPKVFAILQRSII